MPRCWTFVSHDDGALGAAFTVSLAFRVAEEGRRVLVLDLSPSFPALDLAFGVAERVVYTLGDVQRLSPETIFLSPEKGKCAENILFVPLRSEEDIVSGAPLACIEAAQADVVLICADTAAASLTRTVSDHTVLLTRATEPSARTASRIAARGGYDAFLYTDFVPTKEAVLCETPLVSLADIVSLPLFGILPRVDLKNTLRPQGKDFRTAITNIAGRVLGEDIPLLRGISVEGMRKRTFFERISK